ncbi:FAD/NAD(P)-binding protein [Xenorhabdus doucetiae]|uniref:FAD-NAD(P)-binding protein n=1 Tax=Xenorhabdus doucetiae TaxID=351671 RepID=A0A068QPN4_9GAMM|nr:FAD/NAD(P)-binding protein [Xenorhabdus doucetiae]TYP13510.1 FAD-NAD(P)-binding protein [Xenorhabdus doucetiae]CDG17017.1 putative FAD dependent oxidoreductase [Xenorhabdus doucetiae]
MMSFQKRSLAIVGGGAAGVTTFIAAVQHRAAQVIYIVDPGPIGPGMAFFNLDGDILCNTSVDTMSVVSDNPLDFLDYLHEHGHAVTPESFVPRQWVGNYLNERFSEFSAIARQAGIDVFHVPHLFRQLKVNSHRRYTLWYGDVLAPKPLEVTDVIFCTGFGASRIPDALKPHLAHPTFIHCPYPETGMLTKIPTKSRVLVIGSKLSAIDAAILLCREGHHVTMTSPSGDIPAVRSRFMRSSGAFFEHKSMTSIMTHKGNQSTNFFPDSLKHAYLKYFRRTLNKYTKIPWREQFSNANSYRERLREEISIAEQGKSQWQDITVNFMDVINEIHLTDKTYFDGTFHPNVEKMLHRYITAIALPNARKLLHYMDSDVLTIQQGAILNVVVEEGEKGAWLVNLGQDYQRFDAVVTAVGYHRPYFVIDENGQLEIDAYGHRSECAVSISPEMAASHPYFKEKESIWFVGTPAHRRLWVPNALVVVANIATRVINNMRRIDIPVASTVGNHEKDLVISK